MAGWVAVWLIQHREALRQWESAYEQLGGIVKKGGMSNTGAAEVDSSSSAKGGGLDLRSAIKSELQDFEDSFAKMSEALVCLPA
jgi:hypothetical protein